MKKSIVYLSTFLTIGSFLASTPLIGGTRLKVNVPWEGKTEIDILVKPDNIARLVLEKGTLSVIYQGGETGKIFSGMVKEERLFDQWGLHFDDFNMDGYQDFAIDTSYGYGGVNVFSDIYAFKIETGRFEKILEEVSNIEARPAEKELHTAMKSGPRYITENYRFEGGKPYKYIEQIVMFNGLDLATIFDKSGKIIRRLVVDPADDKTGLSEMKPAIRKVISKRAWLYSSPDDASISKSYLIKGDEVEIRDAKGDGYEWMKIRYKGKKTIVGWVKTEAIIEEGE